MEMKQQINVFKLSRDWAEDNRLCNEYLCDVLCKVCIFWNLFQEMYLFGK